jgi:hypothetical protein
MFNNYLLVIVCVLSVCGAAEVSYGQSGSGEPSTPTNAPSRKEPASSVRTKAKVHGSASETEQSMDHLLPKQLGNAKRTNLNRLNAISTFDVSKEYGAVEVVRADYGEYLRIFISKFEDSASPLRTMQAFIDRVVGKTDYHIIKRESVTLQSGQQEGDLVILQKSSEDGYKQEYLMFSYDKYLYRVYTSNKKFDHAEEFLKLLPLK